MDSSNGDAGDFANSIQNHQGSEDIITDKVASPSREDRLKRLRAKSELEIERRHNEIMESNKASNELRQRLQEERRQKIEQLKQREEERKRRVEERRQQLHAEERARSEQLQRRTQEREARMSVSVQMQPQPPSRKCRPAAPQMTRSCVAAVCEAPSSQRHAGCFMPCQRASLTRVKGVLAWGPPREPVRSKGGASTSWWLPGAVRSHASTPSGLDRAALRSPSSAPSPSLRTVKAASMRYLGPTIASANQNKGRQEADSPRGRASSTAGSERASSRSVSQSARPASESETVSMATRSVRESRTVSKVTKEAGVVPKATKSPREWGTIPRATKTTREVAGEAGTVPKATIAAPALKAALGGPSTKKAPSKGLLVSPRPTAAHTEVPPSPAPAKAKEGPETSVGVAEEERVAAEELQKEAYRAKMAEQRRLAREARERQEEEQRRAEEEARARMEAERERMEVEARQIAAEEAERQRLLREEAEAEEERLRAEEEADRLQKAVEEEARRARVAAEDEQRQERRRQVDSIMSRLKRPEEGDGPAPGVAGAPGTDGEAPQFKSRLLRSMLGSGRLAVASSGSLAGQDGQEAPLAHSRSCHGGLGQMAADLGLRGRHSSLHDSLLDENGLGDDDGGPRLAGDASVAAPGLPLELLS